MENIKQIIDRVYSKEFGSKIKADLTKMCSGNADKYQKKYLKKIKEAIKFGFNSSILRLIIDKIYEDGFQDGQDDVLSKPIDEIKRIKNE